MRSTWASTVPEPETLLFTLVSALEVIAPCPEIDDFVLQSLLQVAVAFATQFTSLEFLHCTWALAVQ